MPRCLLFAYGLLRPGYRPPRTLSRHWPDRMRGMLYDLGSYPGAVAIGSAAGTFAGEVLDIDAEELDELDEFEDTTDGTYLRKRARTVAGSEVWVYEYAGPLPPGAQPIDRWPDSG